MCCYVKEMSPVTIVTSGSLRAGTRHHREILCYGNSFPPTFSEVLLAHASPNDWPIVVKHANNDKLEAV